MTHRDSGPTGSAAQLWESEERYRQLFGAHPHPMWVYDLETLRFLAVNDAAIAKYGYTLDEFLGMQITDIRPPDEVPDVLESVRTRASSAQKSGVWRHRTKQGDIISVEVSSHTVEFAGRQGSLVHALDVTARLAAETALAVERDRLEEAQRVAKVGNWETDLSTLKVIWSAETYRIFGLDPASFSPTHETFLEHVHPNDREMVDEAFRNSLQTRDLCTLSHRLVLKDGSVKHVEERWRVFVDAAGTPIRASGTTQDISDRAEAAAAVEQGQSLLRVASSISRLGAFSVDLQTGARFWSDELSTIFDLERGHTLPLTEALDRYVPADKARMREAYDRCVREGIPYDLELEAITRTGRHIWVRTIGEAIRDAEGEVIGIRGATQDITDRRLAAEALRRSEERFRQSFANAPVGMILTDPAGHFLEANATFCRMLGYDAEELRARSFADLTHPDDIPTSQGVVQELSLRGVAASTFEKRYIHRTGRPVWVRLSVTAHRDEAGGVINFIGVVEDITASRAAAEALRRSEAQLLMASTLSGLGAWTIELPEGLLNISPAARAIQDLDPDEPVTIAEATALYIPEHRGIITDAYLACVEKGQPFDLQLQQETRRGRHTWVRAIGRAVRDLNGGIVRVEGALQDVTSRVEAEARERSLASDLQQTLQNISDAFFTMDDSWRIRFVNRRAEQLLRLPREDLVGQVLWDVFAPAVGTEFEHQYRLAMSSGKTIEFESFYPPLDSWFAVRAYPSREGLAVYFRDVTEQRRAQEALRVSDERFRVVFEQAGIGMALVDAVDGRIARGNAALATMLGYEVEELTSLTVEQISETTEYQEDREQWERMVRGEIPRYQMAKRYFRKDGKVIWGFLTCTLVRDGAERPRFILGMVEDITQARAMQEALRNSEQRLQLLVEATNDAVYEWDLVTDGLTWNDGFGAQFGYVRSEVEPTLAFFNARIHPDDLARITEEMQHALNGSGDTWAGEYRFRRGDGRYAYVLDRGHILRDESGRALRMVGGLNDLTERKATEERLEQQAALLDAAHDAIHVMDLDGRITYWNKGAERTFGWMAHETIGRNAAELFHLDRASYQEAHASLLSQGQWEGELIKRGRDGQDREVAVRWTLVRDRHGEPRAVFAIDTDVTERKRLEMQFLRAQRLESLGTLAGGIAHDLNNVLAPILVSIELLRMDDLDPERLESIATIEASARRGAAMVQQVLTFARGVEGKRVLLDPARIAREVEKIARDTFPKGITIRVATAPDTWTIRADATQVHQILTNLVVNARDAMPRGGVLTLSTANATVDETMARMHPDARPGRYVALAVNDTGIGIPLSVQQRLFEPFFTTKEIGKGTGLGLSMVHTIVRSHEGFTDVHSEPGQGARFVVYLPAAGPGEVPGEAEPESPLPRGHGELVLVVDDEESIRKIVQRILERFGYRVLQAADGAEGLMVFRDQRGAIDVVLTDMAMPVMDGTAMIAELLAIDPEVRIVASSGLTSGGSVAHALASGVTNFITKPYSAETLLTALRKALRGRNSDP